MFMKYILVIVLTVVVMGAAFFGYSYINDDSNSSDVTDTSTSTTEPQKVTGAGVLDLSGQGITEVNSDIYGKTGTTQLVLSNNSIKTLPSQMGKMTKLTLFKIDHNLLEGSLIGEIRQMSQLKTLDVSYNNMTGMPAEIGQLSKLETLNYSYNNIDGLPNELGNLKNNLKEFNLTGNPLSAEKITNLKASLPNTNIIF